MSTLYHASHAQPTQRLTGTGLRAPFSEGCSISTGTGLSKAGRGSPASKRGRLGLSAKALGTFCRSLLTLLCTSFAATGSQQFSVTLAWDPNPEPDVFKYVVYVRQLGETYAPAVSVTNTTSAVIPGLKSGLLYFFAVAAVNLSGLESALSEEISWQAPTIDLGPRIVQQPASQTVSVAQDVTLSVEVAGEGPFHFRWRQNGETVPRGNGATLTLTGIQPSHEGEYDVVITGRGGSVTSQSARLNVLAAPPVILKHPQHRTAAIGETVTFTVELGTETSLPIGYLWRKGRLTLEHHVLTSYTDSLTLASVEPSDADLYQVVITNSVVSGKNAVVSQPALLSVVGPKDSDGDGLPDSYERSKGFRPTDPADGSQDADQDGTSNLQEYIAGTDPLDASSYLRIDRVVISGRTVHFHFNALANRDYLVEYRDLLDRGTWKRLGGVPAISSSSAHSRPGEVVDSSPPTRGTRYYRLFIPRSSYPASWDGEPGAPETIVLEGEEAQLTPPMRIISDSEASNGRYIETPKSDAGEALFNFTATGGTYVVWARCKVHFPNPTAHNSYYASVDDSPETVWHWFYGLYDNFPTGWNWIRLGEVLGDGNSTSDYSVLFFDLAPGDHTLRLTGRETLAKLDRIVITSDSSYDPTAAP